MIEIDYGKETRMKISSIHVNGKKTEMVGVEAAASSNDDYGKETRIKISSIHVNEKKRKMVGGEAAASSNDDYGKEKRRKISSRHVNEKRTENGWRRSRSFIEHLRPGSAAGDRWLLDNRKSDKQCLA